MVRFAFFGYLWSFWAFQERYPREEKRETFPLSFPNFFLTSLIGWVVFQSWNVNDMDTLFIIEKLFGHNKNTIQGQNNWIVDCFYESQATSVCPRIGYFRYFVIKILTNHPQQAIAHLEERKICHTSNVLKMTCCL
jgi:hypothetical protein